MLYSISPVFITQYINKIDLTNVFEFLFSNHRSISNSPELKHTHTHTPNKIFSSFLTTNKLSQAKSNMGAAPSAYIAYQIRKCGSCLRSKPWNRDVFLLKGDSRCEMYTHCQICQRQKFKPDEVAILSQTSLTWLEFQEYKHSHSFLPTRERCEKISCIQVAFHINPSHDGVDPVNLLWQDERILDVRPRHHEPFPHHCAAAFYEK